MAKYGDKEFKDIYGIREIRFRARIPTVCKELNTEEYTVAEAWVYGDLVQDRIGGERCFIKKHGSSELIPVPKETVCEYTGVNGCGCKLYEGDILQKGKRTFVVTWKDGAFGIENVNDGTFKPFCAMKDRFWSDNFKCIGNTIDNPELINKTNNG